MSPTFDPYYVWLGIPPDEQPPTLYRLLGVRPFETDADVIDHAAQRVAMHVASFRTGAHRAAAEQILSEIRSAHATLLNHEHRPAYDRALYAQLQAAAAWPRAATASSPAERPAPMPAPVVVQVPMPMQPTTAPVVVVVPVSAAAPVAGGTAPLEPPARRVPRMSSPAREQIPTIPQPVQVILGGMAGLLLGYVLLYFLLGHDLLGLLPARNERPPAVEPR
jgi:hypothetical protein